MNNSNIEDKIFVPLNYSLKLNINWFIIYVYYILCLKIEKY